MANKYFLYSREQHKLRLEIEKKIGRKYIPGKVMVNGKYRNFTEINTQITNRFNDFVVVYFGDADSVHYIEPETK